MTEVGSSLNNRYRLDRKIGEGGFAEVFLATDLELGRQVAVKVMARSWARDQEFIRRFRTEARAVAALDHPHILPIYDFGTANDMPFLVMPFAAGGTLATRIKQRPSPAEIVRYLREISSALDYAHQQRIVHRDIKPTNILIHRDGRLVLTDFGLAKLIDNLTTAAQTQVLGTAAYMAPEQFQGLVSPASDIYALGVMLYEMVVGKLPYEGNTREVLLAHFQATPASLVGHPATQGMPPAVVAALDRVMQRALAKHPADRYPSCQALYEAFASALGAGGAGEERVQPDATQVGPSKPAPLPSPADSEATIIAPPPVQPRPVALRPPRLIVTTEPDQGVRLTFELTDEHMTLGREADNALCVPFSIVSRRHAALQRIASGSRGPQYKIVDLKSVNHLYFQGREIMERVLEDGDVIEIGVRGFGPYIVRLMYQAPVPGVE
ncbi:MAG: hypothetical protein KatS3mg057_2158 [Herpetosiphonaceae bacterium]|nr:MAG: hypothetical protein KatS3mg057_2158 [Herpetosiphonaceae bacterium]